MNTVLNLLSAAAVVVSGAYAFATAAPDANAVQPVAKLTHSQLINKPITEPQWAESPFMQPEPQMASVAPRGEVLRGAQWITVSDDVETAHAPKANNQHFVF